MTGWRRKATLVVLVLMAIACVALAFQATAITGGQ